MADRSCVYYETFETLYQELPIELRDWFHTALMNRGLFGVPLPKVEGRTYWDGKIDEAFKYAESLFSANERKRAAGAKGGSAKRASSKNEKCLKHTSSNVNVNVNDNVNGNGNANGNANANDRIKDSVLSSGMALLESQPSDNDKYEWED